MRCCDPENKHSLKPCQINRNCIPIEFPADDPNYADKCIFCQQYVRLQSTLQVPTPECDCDIGFAIVNWLFVHESQFDI